MKRAERYCFEKDFAEINGEILECRDLMTFSATHLEVLAVSLDYLRGVAVTDDDTSARVDNADVFVLASEWGMMDELREAIFAAYAQHARHEQEHPTPDDEHTRCANAMRSILEILEDPDSLLTAAHLSWLDLIFAYWREVEVAPDAPGVRNGCARNRKKEQNRILADESPGGEERDQSRTS